MTTHFQIEAMLHARDIVQSTYELACEDGSTPYSIRKLRRIRNYLTTLAKSEAGQ